MCRFNRAQLQRIFNELDQNGDGLVSLDELARVLDVLGVDAKRDDLELLVGGKNLGYIDFIFFCETLMKRDLEECKPGEDDEITENDLQRAFRVFDLDGDGFISCEELRIALSKLGLWGGHDCRSMIDVYDANSDGLLDFEEFRDMMQLTSQA